MLISSLRYTGSYNRLRENRNGRRGQAIRAWVCSTSSAYLGVFFSSYLECSHFVSRKETGNLNYSSIVHCCYGVCELIDLLCAFLSKPAHNKKLEPVNLSFLYFRGRKINGRIEIKTQSGWNLTENELPGLLTLILEKIPPSLRMALLGQNSLDGWIFSVVGGSDFSITTWQHCLLQPRNNWSWDLKTFCHLPPANLTWH